MMIPILLLSSLSTLFLLFCKFFTLSSFLLLFNQKLMLNFNSNQLSSSSSKSSSSLLYIISFVIISLMTTTTTTTTPTIMSTNMNEMLSNSSMNGRNFNKYHHPKYKPPSPIVDYQNDDELLQMDQPLPPSSSSKTTNVIVISGQKAQLSCPLFDNHNNNHNHRINILNLLKSSSSSSSAAQSGVVGESLPIKWQKDNKILPYDHRQHINSNGTLIIQSTQKRMDEGNYYCYLDESVDKASIYEQLHKNLNDDSAIIHLKVMDPPHVAPFEFPNDLQVGMKTRAICSVMKGDQPFKFLWTQNGNKIESDIVTDNSGAIYRIQNFRDYSMLTIDSLTLSHAGNITCTVSNDLIKTKISQSSLLKVNAPPQWIIEPNDSEVILHQSIRIDCLASGSPKPFTTWKRALGTSPWEYIPIYNTIHYYLHSNGSLTIKSATQQQSGSYICQSTNGYGNDIGKLIHLKVNEPPRFRISTLTQVAIKNKSIRLICPPDGDQPIQMEWYRIDSIIIDHYFNNNNNNDTNNNNRFSSISKSNINNINDNDKLILLNPNNNDDDRYMFEIREISSKYLSEEYRTNIENDIMDSNDYDLASYSNDINDDINDSNNNLNNQDIIDQQKQQPHQPQQQTYSKKFQNNQKLIVSILTIRKPMRDDSRIYLCKAINDYGWAELRIRLIVKERPDIPNDLIIKNVTESKAEIQWTETFNGNSKIVNYLLQYRLLLLLSSSSSSSLNNDTNINLDINVNNNEAINDDINNNKPPTTDDNGNSNDGSTSTAATTIQTIKISMDKITSIMNNTKQTVITNLRSNSIYELRLSAKNSIGQSDYTKWIRFRTEQSAPEYPPIDVMATPTGPNSVKITWKAPKKFEWNGEITGYYIGYRAEKSDTDLYKTIENSEINGKHESHITNLHRSTIYKAWVQAFNTRGTGPRSEIVTVQTLADVPPSAPLLRLYSSTSDSITISWSSATYGGGSSASSVSSSKMSSSTNELTLYYRLYQPSSSSSLINDMIDHPYSPGAKILPHQQQSNNNNNNWRDISILEPNGRHTVTGLECGRSYEFFATAHNSVGKSEPSTPLIARTRGEAPSPPSRMNLLSETFVKNNDNTANVNVIVNLINWKHNECPINHFTLRIRPLPNALQQKHHSSSSSSSASSSTSSVMSNGQNQWSILSMQHNPRENFLLRKLSPNTLYEIEITAHSSAGSTQIMHQFLTSNLTNNNALESSYINKLGYENSKISSIAYPPPPMSSTTATNEISFADYEILLPIISSLIVVIVIISVACFLCSRDHHSLFLQPITANQQSRLNNNHHHHHNHQRQQSIISENKIPFQHHPLHHMHTNDDFINDHHQQQQEMSILKELVRSSSLTIMNDLHSSINNNNNNNNDNGSNTNDQQHSSMITTTTTTTAANDYDVHFLAESEPTSLMTNHQSNNHQNNNNTYNHYHHHQLTLISPRHQKTLSKDCVELQSFLNNGSNSSATPSTIKRNLIISGVHHQSNNGGVGGGSSGNYALPYDVLPVTKQQQATTANMAIYGQRQLLQDEPLYATAKLINNPTSNGQKLDDLIGLNNSHHHHHTPQTSLLSSSSLYSSSTATTTTTSNGGGCSSLSSTATTIPSTTSINIQATSIQYSRANNYESLVPIISSSTASATTTSNAFSQG